MTVLHILLLLLITFHLVMCNITCNINDTKLNYFAQMLHFIIRILIKNILAYHSGKEIVQISLKNIELINVNHNLSMYTFIIL